MMRSLFSGVAGLRTHQTRMDVIGNNIANVNTTAYKSQSMVFSDLLYQTTQSASGANNATGRGGINPRQIGLGSKTGAISTAIATQGSAQSTNNPLDIMITGDSFFIVSDGSSNFFTRDGSFTTDAAGNLVMATTGYRVMGWQTDENGDIVPDTVSALQIMKTDNLTYPAESTTAAFVSGIIDKTDTQLASTAGRIMTLSFFDAQGYEYTAKFSVHSTGTDGDYRVKLDDILGTGSDGKQHSLTEIYGLSDISQIASFGASGTAETTEMYPLQNNAECVLNGTTLEYYMTYEPEAVLAGASTDPLVAAAGKTGNWQVNLADGTTVSEGDTVTVTGTATLTQAELEASPYNLIYQNGKYYKDLDGDTLAEEIDTVAEWQTALDLTAATGVTVEDDGSITIAFSKDFEATMDCTYNEAKKQFRTQLEGDDILLAYGCENTADTTYVIESVAPDDPATADPDPGKTAQITKIVDNSGNHLYLSTDNGDFNGIGTQGADNTTVSLSFNNSASTLSGNTIDLTNFSNISIDFSQVFSSNNGGLSTAGMTSGDLEGYNTGRKFGEMIGIEVGQDGKITASYDNGQSKLLGQIAVANFANPSGLAKEGNNLYSATMNSGEFDGIGDDITEGGGSMESGVLEMSNVDLSSEFTEMITTQRGFQANSRIITVSDTLLEELVNLKR